ncbi:hypothetical protein BKP64_08700 [Marinobacter salinus]|uniref:Bacterial virulence factor lipase N-terminal domain-containing protein n=1 Tax=Marinobacter salinus TaxID=1874317 RepID=A0A1D9GKR1_9GAMM|nr:hypothetical protein [Marinobacter salinus]AOY88236.1 hypothetical protein BKP64_08700 [Marinobacter salinus]
MFKKTLISLAVASSLGLTGCFDSGDTGANANPDYKISNPDFTGKTWPIFNPVTSELPVPSDLQFEQGANADGTLSGSTDNPITNALDYMDGSSTTAQFDIKLSGSINPETVVAQPIIDAGAGTPAPNPNQNVFLLSLNFPGGDALLNSSSYYTDLIAELAESGDITEVLDRESFPGETPTFDLGLAFAALQAAPGPDTAAAVFDFNNEFRAEVVSLDGGVDNVLRITPLRPLDPKKKYLVVVTDEVKDSLGQSLVGSPSYQNISNPDEPLGTSSLEPVRGAIQGWEALAAGYFSALTNTSREAASMPPLSAENVALSLTFTTGGTTDVLEAATSPAQFFYKSAIKTTRQNAIAEYLAANADTFETLDPSTQWGTLDAVADGAVASIGDANLRASAAGTETALAGTDFSNPEPREIGTQFIEATRVPSAGLGLPEAGSVFQTSLELPYYLKTPTDTDPSNLNLPWSASTIVGGAIDPSGETPPSDKVTFRFPFATENATPVNVPMLVSVPDPSNVIPGGGGATCGMAKPWDVVVYQHGIFGNRSHSLALANQLGNFCFVTVAIDLPLHGIAPTLATGDPDPSIALSVDKTLVDGSFVDSPLPMNERHFGWGQDASGSPTRMVYSTDPEEALGYSAQFFLNLSNLPAARDNNRQGVVDLLNLNASLVNLNDIDLDNSDLDGDPTTRGDAQRDVNVQPDGTGGSQVYFVGHSLGGILGTSLVSLVNDTAQAATIGNENIVPFNAAALVTPGAGIAKLLENSPSIGATVLAGLGQAGLTQGTSNLELFLNVAQATLDSAEPHNFGESIVNSGSKVYLNEIYGDGSDRSTQDQTIPVAADVAYAGTYTRPLGDALPAPLAGTEPLFMNLEADTISATGGLTANVNAVRFEAGTHTTIIKPETAAQEAVFADMATNIISFFMNDGTSIQFNNANFVKAEAPSPENP